MITIAKTIDELIKSKKMAPLPLDVIPNRMGINLCNVKGLTWTRQDDGQLLDLKIDFIPNPIEANTPPTNKEDLECFLLNNNASKELQDELWQLKKYKHRIEWLHANSGEVDSDGYEWGIYRVKFVNGNVFDVQHTLSDLTDLDGEMLLSFHRQKTILYRKRQIVKDYMEQNKLTLIDLGVDENVTIENASEEILDSILEDITETATYDDLCEWISIGTDTSDNTEKFIPACNEGRGMPFKNSGFLKYCPFCGKKIGWTTSSLKGEPPSVREVLVDKLSELIAEAEKFNLRIRVEPSKSGHCYNGGAKQCGKCPACIERKHAFEVNGVVDPVGYGEEQPKHIIETLCG